MSVSSGVETSTGPVLLGSMIGQKVKQIASAAFHAASGTEQPNSIDIIPPLPVRARGTFSDVRRQLEKAAQAKWKAVYIFGLLDGSNVRIGTTADPEDLKATGQSWHAEEVVLHGLLWCSSKAEADAIVKGLKSDLSPNLIRGTWYDIAPNACQMAVDFVARRLGISVFTSEERTRAIEQHTYNVIRKAHPGLLTNIVPMNRRVS